MQQQYGRFRTGYFWAVLEPAATVAVLTAIHAGIRGEGAAIYGEDPILFFVFGAIPFFLFFGVVNRTQTAFQGANGLYSFRQIKPIDLFLARAIIESITLLAVGLLFVLLWTWIGRELPVRDPLKLVRALGLLFFIGLGIGLTYGVYGAIFSDLQRVFGITMRPMFFISGLFFTMEMVPLRYRYLVDWNPVLHAIDVARDAALPAYQSPASEAYVLFCAGCFLLLGLAAYRRHLSQLVS
jgi:capsular polysaccharide transport system permease protein